MLTQERGIVPESMKPSPIGNSEGNDGNHRNDDFTAGGHHRHCPAGGRYWHDEYHTGIGLRKDQRDWHP